MRRLLSRRRLTTGVTILSLLLIVFAMASGRQMAIIELKHRSAVDVIPVVSPFIGPEDTLSGQDNLLFLSTTPENLTRIQAIVAHLDQAYRQLAITVVQGENAIDQLSTVDLSGNVTIGDGVGVGTGDPQDQANGSVTVDSQSSQHTRRSTDIQRVLVQNSATATIYVSLSAPVAMDRLTHKGMRLHQIRGYREMLTGVQVTPRISGNRVTLEIRTQADQPSDDSTEVVRTQQIQTQIEVQLNEWIDIGSILGASNRQDAGPINRSASQQSGQRHVFVKVAEGHP